MYCPGTGTLDRMAKASHILQADASFSDVAGAMNVKLPMAIATGNDARERNRRDVQLCQPVST